MDLVLTTAATTVAVMTLVGYGAFGLMFSKAGGRGVAVVLAVASVALFAAENLFATVAAVTCLLFAGFTALVSVGAE